MNLFFRLFWLILVARFRSSCSPLGPCRTPFRVWPTDLDVLRHVNNGVYLSIMDLGRMDLLRRSGLLRPILARGWYPVATGETIQFLRSLELFDRFVIETRVLGWDDKYILLEQRFERRGETAAIAVVAGRFLARGGGTVTPEQILGVTGEALRRPELPEPVAKWHADQLAWRERVRGAGRESGS
ncbi:MAG TPA: acyl-CoA thioesterase [Gemmatimonadaceae bacterium]|nr:acyl-CoA thioesterase [Gemmatimonadaceae bacterium]